VTTYWRLTYANRTGMVINVATKLSRATSSVKSSFLEVATEDDVDTLDSFEARIR
jgi:hypothetical protein